MPMPVVSKGCNDAFSRADQRMITNDFTTRLYISPPDIPDHCNELFTMTVYDKNGDEYNETITSAGSSSVELADEYEKAFSTNAGEMRIYRFGSILNHPDNITGYGHFMHYIPSIQEWVKGKTQFYTLAKDCSIEFYADEDGYNPDLITVDGIVLSKYKYTFSYMKYFKKKYGHFILPITRYGLHTIENDGNYILYVICKNVNSAYDAAAYVTGFNKRKAQNF
uniref:Astacin domain-containing protein n=1 Tax=Rhabditophanes sp. KR3021 TaxID=114890 RepID=A0AC35TNT3_9BILA